MTKRLVSLVMTFMIIFSSMNITVYAQIMDTISNASDLNESIVEDLKDIDSSSMTDEELEAKLKQLGVISDDGDWITSSIVVDGMEMTLEEVTTMLQDESINLDKEVTVGEAVVSLRDLKTMVDIENQIDRLRKELLSDDVILTEEHKEAIDSIKTQIKSEGIEVKTAQNVNSDDVYVIDKSVRVTPEVDFVSNEDGIMKYRVTGALNKVQNKDVRFRYYITYGNFTKLLSDDDSEEKSGSGEVNIVDKDGTSFYYGDVVISEGDINGESDYMIEVKVKDMDSFWDKDNWEGEAFFFVQCDKPSNALFDEEKLTHNIPIGVKGSATYRADFKELNNSLNKIPNKNAGETCFDYEGTVVFNPQGKDYGEDNYEKFIYRGSDDKARLSIFRFEYDLSIYAPLLLDSIINNTKPLYVIYENDEEEYYGYIRFMQSGNYGPTKTSMYWETIAWDNVAHELDAIDFNHEISDYKKKYKDVIKDSFDLQIQNNTVNFFGTKQENSMTKANKETIYYKLPLVQFESRVPSAQEIIEIDGTYDVGSVYPIVLEFDTPAGSLDGDKLPYITLSNGKKVVAAVSEDECNKRLVYPYELTEDDFENGFIEVESYSNVYSVEGLSKKKTEGFKDGRIDLPKRPSVKQDVIDDIDVDLNNFIATITINLEDDIRDDNLFWIAYEQNKFNTIQSISARAESINGVEELFFRADDLNKPTKLTTSFQVPNNTGDVSKSYDIAFFIDDSSNTYDTPNDYDRHYMYGLDKSYELGAVKLIKEGDISIIGMPKDDTIFTQDLDFKLSYALSGSDYDYVDPDDFIWESSNIGLANVVKDENGDGKIIFNGSGQGEVYFSLTALNGGIEPVTIKTKTIEVKKGLEPYLVIPSHSSDIKVKINKPATLMWSSNLAQKKIDDINEDDKVFDYTVSLYKAEYIDSKCVKGEKVFDDTIESMDGDKIISSYIFKKELFQTASQKNKKSFIAEVAAEGLSASAYIEVLSVPMNLELEELDSYFITDSDKNLKIDFTIENLEESKDNRFYITVTKNEEKPRVFEGKELIDEGYLDLQIDSVEGFKDIYTVSATIENTSSKVKISDSYVVYVYNNSALKIMIDDKYAEEEESLSNIDTIKDMSQEEILDLGRDISLSTKLTINGKDYKNVGFTDQIEWNSSNNNVASIYYNDFGFYQDIVDHYLGYYSPGSEFMLSGLNDGDTIISATHPMSGIKDEVRINVETLKNKLYLIQAFPKVKTKLVSTNGKGEKIEYTSDDKGAFAIYEDSGIKTDIYLSSDNNGTYLGTINIDKLKTSESNGVDSKLYPLNIIKLKPVEKLNLKVLKPDGTPYEGRVKVKGGTFKNDEYCTKALFRRFGETTPTTYGVKPLVYNIVDGRIQLEFDSTQFITQSYPNEVMGLDRITYTMEIEFGEDVNGDFVSRDYYPVLVEYDAFNNRGQSIIHIEPMTKGKEHVPRITSQRVVMNNKQSILVSDDTEYIGPNANIPEIELITRVLCLNVKDDNAEVSTSIEDQYGVTPAKQVDKAIDYPFLTYPVIENHLNLSSSGMWFDKGKRSIGINVIKDTQEASKLNIKPKLINMLNARNVLNGEEIEEMPETIVNELLGGVFLDLDDGGDFLVKAIFKGIDVAANIGVSPVQMYIKPTKDPAQFDALIQIDLEKSFGKDPVFVPSYGGWGNLGVDTNGDFDLKRVMNKSFKDLAGRVSGTDFGITGGGYLQAKVLYDFDNDDWDVVLTNSNINMGANASYSIMINQLVGPVPVTADFNISGELKLNVDIATKSGEQILALYKEKFVNDYLVEVRGILYAEAFAGLGFDYSVVAFKIGVFGTLELQLANRWLNRPYLKKDANKVGQMLSLEGETGIEFYFAFIFIEYEKVFASIGAGFEKKYNDWEYIEKYWANELDDTESEKMLSAMGMAPVKQQVTVQDRSYLSQYNRSWESTAPKMMLMSSRESSKGPEVDVMQINSYPYSNPVFTDDGQVMAYVSDKNSPNIDETRVCISDYNGLKYLEGKEVEYKDGYGDSSLEISGNKDFYMATWVKQFESINKDESQAVTAEDIALMSNSMEIMALVDDKVIRLTDNGNADLSPIVACNDDNGIIAFRSVYSDNSENPTEFEAYDSIKYYYYKNGKFTDVANILYEGFNGNVKGINMAMLDDGTACIVYTVFDKERQKSDIMYSVIDNEGNIVNTIKLTNNDLIDQNPQITTAVFEDGEERFVIGWYSCDREKDYEDIRLACVNRNSGVYNGFIDSINATVDKAKCDISPNFTFPKGVKDVIDLSILWKSMVIEHNDTDDKTPDVYKDAVFGIKVLKDEDTGYYVSSPCKLFELYMATQIDHFDARVDSTGRVHSIIQGSNYAFGKVKKVLLEDGREINIKGSRPDTYTASGSYDNSIRIDSCDFDLDDIVKDLPLPMKITVYNDGIDKIDSFMVRNSSFDFNKKVELGQPLMPAESSTITIDYPFDPSRDKDEIIVYANYMDSLNGKLGSKEVDFIPDLGILEAKKVEAVKGIRRLWLNLHNDNDILINPDRYDVKVDIYQSADKDSEPIYSYRIDEDKDIDAINVGEYSKYIDLDLKPLIEENQEIPVNGIQLTMDVSLIDSEGEVIKEHNELNNSEMITYKSLIEENNNQIVTVESDSHISNGKTTVMVTVKNNSLINASDGNIIIKCIDEDNNEVVTQGFNPNDMDKGLLKLGIEEAKTKVFAIDKPVTLESVIYSDTVLMNTNSKLSTLKIKEVPLAFDSEIYNYDIDYDCTKSLRMSVASANPEAEITVNGDTVENGFILLNTKAENTITIKVVAVDGSTTEYSILVNDTNNNNNTQNPHEPTRHKKKKRKVSTNKDLTYIDINSISTIFKGRAVRLNVDKISDEPVTFKLEDSMKNKKVYLYGYDKDIELMGMLEVDSKGEITFTPNKSNSYVLTDKLLLGDNKLANGVRDKGYINGYEDGSIRPDNPITRAQTAKLLSNILAKATGANTKTFNDIDMWAKDSIIQLSDLGIINGYENGDFRPNKNITRAEFVKLITNIININDIQSYKNEGFRDIETHWAKAEIMKCYRLSLVNGSNGHFRPNENITRAEAITIVNRLINRTDNSSSKSNPFNDLSKAHWAYDEILKAID